MSAPVPPLDLFVNDSSNTLEVNDKLLEIGKRLRYLSDPGVLLVGGLTLPSGAANLVIATPNGTTGVSVLRALVVADLPAIPDSKLTSNVALLNRTSQTFTGDPQIISGKLGVGAAPSVELHVKSVNPTLTVETTTNGGTDFSRVILKTPTQEWRIVNDRGTSDDLVIYDATAAVVRIVLDTTGRVGIGTAAPKSNLHVTGLPVYANNAAAVAGGLTAGAFYRTGADPDPVCVVH